VNRQIETIGECEICGILDHHLVAGECPRCHARVQADAREYARHRIAAKARHPRSAYAPSLSLEAAK